MNEDVISVIVPIYNTEKYLERCICSIINQTYHNLEIILVDDGSQDKSPEICDAFALEDSRIKVIHQENGGQSVARNHGLNVSTGSIIMYVDSDDFLDLECIQKLYTLMEKYNAQISQCKEQVGNGDVLIKCERSPSIKLFDNSCIFCDSERRGRITAWAKLYTKEVAMSASFPVGRLIDDEFYTYKTFAASKRIVTTDEELYYHFANPCSIMRSKYKVRSLDFIDAYNERIRFYHEKGDDVGEAMSLKEYAIRIMTMYIGCKSDSENENDTDELFELYKSVYKSLYMKDKIPSKERVSLFLFRWFHDITPMAAKYYACMSKRKFKAGD